MSWLKLGHLQIFALLSKNQLQEKTTLQESSQFLDYFHPKLNHPGFGFSKQEQYFGAIDDFTKAVELAPKYADAYFNRGESYKALGKNQEADAEFAKGKRIKMTVPANSKTDADETGK